MRAVWLLWLLAACVEFDHGDRAMPDPTDPAPVGSGSGSAGSGSAAYAVPHIVQSASQAELFGSSMTVPIAAAAAGHVIIAGVTVYGQTTTVTSVTDNLGTALRDAKARATVFDGATEIWYGPAAAGVTSVTVKFSDSFGGGGTWVLEVDGLDGTAPDVALAPDLSIASLVNAPPVTTRTPGALVLSVANVPGGVIAGIHPGNMFQMLPVENGDASAYAIAAAPGPYAAAWDTSTGTSACASTAAFAAAKL